MPERVGLWRKSGKRGLLITSYKRLVKHSDRVKTAAEAGIVPAHLWLPQSKQVKKLCQVHAQCSLGRSCYRPKKSCVYGYIVTSVQFSSVQFSSVAHWCPTLCDPMNRSMPGLPVHHQLPEFALTHVHRVSDAIQPSHPLSSPSPPAPNPSQHQSLFQ